MKVFMNDARELSPGDAHECARLSFRERGCLQDWIRDARRSDYTRPERVYRIFDGSTLVAWGMTYHETWTLSGVKPAIGIYVRKTYRRRGLGALVLALMQAEHPGIKFAASDHSAKARALYARERAKGMLKDF